jgi:hypothetical protein
MEEQCAPSGLSSPPQSCCLAPLRRSPLPRQCLLQLPRPASTSTCPRLRRRRQPNSRTSTSICNSTQGPAGPIGKWLHRPPARMTPAAWPAHGPGRPMSCGRSDSGPAAGRGPPSTESAGCPSMTCGVQYGTSRCLTVDTSYRTITEGACGHSRGPIPRHRGQRRPGEKYRTATNAACLEGQGLSAK